MNRTMWGIASLGLGMALALLGSVEAQPYQQQQRGGAQTAQTQPDEATQEAPDQEPMQGMMQQMQGMMQQMQGMMQQMHSQMGQGGMMGRGMMQEREDDPSGQRGMMGRGMRGHGMRGRGMMGRGMMQEREDDDPSGQRDMMGRGMMGHMQRMMDRLTQQLDLSDDQQMKVQDLLRTHAKEGIRLKADIDTASIDLHQLLDAQPIDMDQVKTTLQAIAAKEADLHLAHIAAMQDIQQLLTPEQQEQFRDLWGHMGHMMASGGKKAHGGKRGRMGSHHPHGMQHGKPSR